LRQLRPKAPGGFGRTVDARKTLRQSGLYVTKIGVTAYSHKPSHHLPYSIPRLTPLKDIDKT
jgi:hypothetical protein